MEDDFSSANFRNNYCGPTLESSVPRFINPLQTGGIYLGGDLSRGAPNTNVVRYRVFRPENGPKSPYYSNGCILTLSMNFADNPALGNSGYITLQPNDKCSEWPDLKIVDTENWCGFEECQSFDPGCELKWSGKNSYFPENCASIARYKPCNDCVRPAGNNYFVYFDGTGATSVAASLNTSDAFGPDAAPSSSILETESLPTSSSTVPIPAATSAAIKTPMPKIFLLLFPLLFLGAHAELVSSDPRGDLIVTLGVALVDYLMSLGRCTKLVSEVIIQTGINGSALRRQFYKSPVGDAKLTGPKLEYIPSRTWWHYGDACNDENAVPNVIESNSIKSIFVGDSYWGLATPEVDMYYAVYKPDGTRSNCVLKIYINDSGKQHF